DEVDDGRRDVTRQDEIPVEGVCLARLVHGTPRGDQRLCQNLPTKNSRRAERAVPAAIDVHLQRLQIEELQQFLRLRAHAAGGEEAAMPTRSADVRERDRRKM